MHASEHTRLMNKFIGLCHDTVSWPNILRQLGYKVQLVEQTISLKSAEKIVPDVVAVSERLSHAIVADCKSGNNIDAKQDCRYLQLTPGDLTYVTVHDTNQLTHIVCYVDNDSNHTALETTHNLAFYYVWTECRTGKKKFRQKKNKRRIAQINPS